MKFAAPILAAAVAMTPAVEGYSLFGPSFFEPSFALSPMSRRLSRANRLLDDSSLIRRFDNGFKQMSPRYEIVNSDDQLQIALDVPGVKMEDVDVSLDDNVLTIRASRRERTDESSFSSQFSQSFALDQVVDVDHLTAHLVDGVLTVSAPKDAKRLEQNVKSIPVLESAPPAVETPKLVAEEDKAVAEEETAEEKVGVVAEEKDEEVVDFDEK